MCIDSLTMLFVGQKETECAFMGFDVDGMRCMAKYNRHEVYLGCTCSKSVHNRKRSIRAWPCLTLRDVLC